MISYKILHIIMAWQNIQKSVIKSKRNKVFKFERKSCKVLNFCKKEYKFLAKNNNINKFNRFKLLKYYFKITI